MNVGKLIHELMKHDPLTPVVFYDTYQIEENSALCHCDISHVKEEELDVNFRVVDVPGGYDYVYSAKPRKITKIVLCTDDYELIQ